MLPLKYNTHHASFAKRHETALLNSQPKPLLGLRTELLRTDASVLVALQQQINKLLDLDKSDIQAAANDNVPQDEQAAETFVECPAVERRKGITRIAEPASQTESGM